MFLERSPYCMRAATPPFPRPLVLVGAALALVALLGGPWGVNGFMVLSLALGMVGLIATLWPFAGLLLTLLDDKAPWREIARFTLLTIAVGSASLLVGALWWPSGRVALAGFRPTSLSAPAADITHALRTRPWHGLRVIRRFYIRPGRRLVIATAHRRLSVPLPGSRAGVAFYAVHFSIAPIPIPHIDGHPAPRWAVYLDRRDATIRYTPRVLQAMLHAMQRGLVLLRARKPVSRATVRASWRHRVTIHAGMGHASAHAS